MKTVKILVLSTDIKLADLPLRVCSINVEAQMVNVKNVLAVFRIMTCQVITGSGYMKLGRY